MTGDFSFILFFKHENYVIIEFYDDKKYGEQKFLLCYKSF
jgi:hypothetical protein